MPVKRESIPFRTPLSRTQRAHVTRLHQEYKVKPNEKRFWEREYRTSTGIGATSPVERPGGRRKTRRIRGGVGKHTPQSRTPIDRAYRADILRNAAELARLPGYRPAHVIAAEDLADSRKLRETMRKKVATQLPGGSKRKSRKNRA